MSTTEERLRGALQAACARWENVTEDEAARRPGPQAWSAREVLGHLIDSASNNHGRFVRARHVDHLDFDGYDQNAWIEVQGYSQTPWSELLVLWRAYNLHLARVIELTPVEVREAPRARHALERIAWKTVPQTSPATLGYFMDDYVGHLEHHLAQIDRTLAQVRAGR